MTAEVKQNLFKAVAGLAAFGFAATGHDAASPLMTALVSITGGWAGQFGVELCMPFITKRWLSGSREPAVNHHIQRSLVVAIQKALDDIETDYLSRDGISPKEDSSLRLFFQTLRNRSQQEYVEATQEELAKQEVLDYVYNRAASQQQLQAKLKIDFDTQDEEFYFTPAFIDYFPTRFAERTQFYFREELKGSGDQQEKAKKAMDLLFFETLQATLNNLRDTQQASQIDLKQLLDQALTTGTQTLQQIDFYGELWISAIRQNRSQLDRIEQRQDKLLEQVGYVRADMATKEDVAALGRQFNRILSQPVSAGLLMSEQFLQLTQAVRESRQAFADAEMALTQAEASLSALEAALTQNPALASSLEMVLTQQRTTRDQANQTVLSKDREQQQAQQALSHFLDEVATVQKAIQNSTSHRADEARKLVEQGRFAEAHAALNADELRRDLADLLQQRDALRQQSAQLAQDFILKASTTVLTKEPGWLAEAWRLYEDAVSADETYDTCFALAYFLQAHNQHLDAVAWYERALRLSSDESQRATTLNNLAVLYRANQRFAEAEAAYDEALSIRRQLAQQSPAAYLPNVATTLNNLAILYRANQRFAEAEAAYDEALSLYRQLAQQSPAAYLPNVATTLNNLAVLYSDNQRFAEAEAAYDEALSLYRQLAQQSPAAYLPDVATTLNNLAVLYSDNQRFAEAEAAYDEALSIRRQLAQQSPAAYLPDVAMTLNNLAILYSDNQRFTEAEAAYDEALSIRRQLAQQSPAAYLPDVATTLNNLAVLYSDNQRFAEAEAAYDEALSI
ncbi:tetratricopeptide repeat protein, partial [Spirosoma lacussanchae]|uniref:tetratricopeptide repeat protein n=1 Tax=Spirosoma lacussanchae TaxID=1884249 RepID=UPI001BB1C731